jgi:hypothetical protein
MALLDYTVETRHDFIVSNAELTNTELADYLGVCHATITMHRGRQRHAIEPNCLPGIGAQWEEWTAELLVARGYMPELQPYRAKFDILVNGIVRIDVKTSFKKHLLPKMRHPIRKFKVKANYRKYSDIYFCIMGDTPDDYFIIPTSVVPESMNHIQFTWPFLKGRQRNWQQYHQRWDLLDAALANHNPTPPDDEPVAGVA